jgi:hypothetical protein
MCMYSKAGISGGLAPKWPRSPRESIPDIGDYEVMMLGYSNKRSDSIEL